MTDDRRTDKDAIVERLDSAGLAELIVDALLQAKIVSSADVQRALKIATEEIEVRKNLGDY